jgi:hypothetical protein
MGTKIYHITHIDNLSGIAKSGLWSDARRLKSDLECKIVGINTIKEGGQPLQMNLSLRKNVGAFTSGTED